MDIGFVIKNYMLNTLYVKFWQPEYYRFSNILFSLGFWKFLHAYNAPSTQPGDDFTQGQRACISAEIHQQEGRCRMVPCVTPMLGELRILELLRMQISRSLTFDLWGKMRGNNEKDCFNQIPYMIQMWPEGRYICKHVNSPGHMFNITWWWEGKTQRVWHRPCLWPKLDP